MRPQFLPDLLGLALLVAPVIAAPAAAAAEKAPPVGTPIALPPFHLKDAALDAELIRSERAVEAASAKVQTTFWPAVRALTAALKAPPGSELWQAARSATLPALIDLAACKRAYQARAWLLQRMESSLEGDELAQVRSFERQADEGALAAEQNRAEFAFSLAKIHPDDVGGS